MSANVLSAVLTIQGVKDAATGSVEVTPVEFGSSGMTFKANDETQAPKKPPEEVITTTKAAAAPAATTSGADVKGQSLSSQTSAAAYPKMIIACVVPLLGAMLVHSHKPSTSTGTSVSVQ